MNFSLLEDVAHTVDCSVHFQRLLQFFYVFDGMIPLHESCAFEDAFSPAHLRHFFMHPPSDLMQLEAPYWFYVKLTAANWRGHHGESLAHALRREYSKREELEAPDFLLSRVDAGSEDAEEAADILLTELSVQQRIHLLYDVVCVLMPWHEGNFFDGLLGGKEPPFQRLRFPTFTNSDVHLIAERFLYVGENIIAYDQTTWDSLFVSDNVLTKSRRPADKSTIKELRDHIPDSSLLAFDDRCRRNVSIRLQIESRKRSSRIIERSSRQDALSRLAEQNRQERHSRPSPPPKEEPKRESRAERLAKREQLKALQQTLEERSQDESQADHLLSETGEMIDVVECAPEPMRLVLRLPSSSLYSDAEDLPGPSVGTSSGEDGPEILPCV